MCRALFQGLEDRVANRTDSCPHGAYMQSYTPSHFPASGPLLLEPLCVFISSDQRVAEHLRSAHRAAHTRDTGALSRSSAPWTAPAGALTGPGRHRAVFSSDGCYQSDDLCVHALDAENSEVLRPGPYSKLVLKSWTKTTSGDRLSRTCWGARRCVDTWHF